MNIEFTKNGSSWVAEFKVTGQFNLHMEMAERENILIMQKTPINGKYAIVEDADKFNYSKVVDFDSGVFFGEKYIKVVCNSEPLYAFLTTEGDVETIKSQSKEVEVTANGTMDITPDAGFSYLNSVKVKTNVPQSGEGGGSASGSAMEYVAFDSEKDLLTYGEYLGAFAYLVKYPTKIETISLMMAMGETVNDAVAFAICPNAVIDFQGEKKTIKDWASDFGANLDLLPRITEAEFYNLNA